MQIFLGFFVVPADKPGRAVVADDGLVPAVRPETFVPAVRPDTAEPGAAVVVVVTKKETIVQLITL